jgi:hypothetical protein
MSNDIPVHTISVSIIIVTVWTPALSEAFAFLTEKGRMETSQNKNGNLANI